MALWCIVMPLTSFLLIPSAQGTIPAYVLGFASVFLVIFSRDWRQPATVSELRYFKIALLLAGSWLLLLCGSQLGHLLSDRRDFGDMVMNSPDDTRVVLRPVLYTQSLYLAACLCIALFFRFFFRHEWMRYVLWGGWFLAIYGIYEWLFFLIFQQTGDFIANRTYGEEMRTGKLVAGNPDGTSQLVTDKIHLWRAFLFLRGGNSLSVPGGAKQAQMALGRAALLCRFLHLHLLLYRLPFCLILYCLFQRKLNLSIALLLLLFAGAVATLYYAYPETFDSMFTAKMNGENDSGAIHQESAASDEETLKTFTPMNWLFGIGFG